MAGTATQAAAAAAGTRAVREARVEVVVVASFATMVWTWKKK